MVSNPKSFAPLREKNIKHKAGSGMGLQYQKHIEEYAQAKGIGYMIDEDSSIVIPGIDPGDRNLDLLMRAYDREISFSEKGKNQKDRDGGTIRSFHSSTSAVLVVIGKMRIVYGTMVEVVLKWEGETEEQGRGTGQRSKGGSSSSRGEL